MMNEKHKKVFIKGQLDQIPEPAGISYFVANILVAVTSSDKNSLLKEKALTYDEILQGMHDVGYSSLTRENIINFPIKYNIIHFDFFMDFCREIYDIIKRKAPEISMENYFDAIGREAVNMSRHQFISMIGEKLSILGRSNEGSFWKLFKKDFGIFALIVKGSIIKNPRFIYKNLDYFNFYINCVRPVVHETDEDILNNRIGIEYIPTMDFDYYNDLNVEHAKSILKWIPAGCGCSKLSSVYFSKKNGNPFYLVKYYPETFSLRGLIHFFSKTIKVYDKMLLEQMEKEIEIGQKENLIEEYSYEINSLQSQLNYFLEEVPENERARRLQEIMKSVLHDWNKHIKNIEYFGSKLGNGFQSIVDSHENELLKDFIKYSNYITFEAQNLTSSVEGIRNYNSFSNNFQSVDVTKLIKTIFEVEKHKIWHYKNAAVFDDDTENVAIKANSYQIHNMISNLLDNAVVHGDIEDPGFYIRLAVSIDKGDTDYLKIVVENKAFITGLNYEKLISSLQKGKLFTTSETGEGQGLKNVINIIKSHNGKYEITYDNDKFTFISYLPITDAENLSKS